MTPRTSALALALCLGFAAPVFAEAAYHPEQAPGGRQNAPAKTASDTIKAMQANVAKMQGQLRRLARAKSDEQRQGIVVEHMQTLHESMMLAEGLSGGMDGCPMMEGMMGNKGGMSMPGMGGQAPGADERMQRMEMMEKMMKGGASPEVPPGMGKP